MTSETIIARSAEPTFAYLIVKRGDRAGAAYQLRPDITNIGRSGENAIRLDDELVSGAHARIRAEGNDKQFYLYDLASTNGTKVNGEAVVRHALQHDDEIELGGTSLVFKQV